MSQESGLDEFVIALNTWRAAAATQCAGPRTRVQQSFEEGILVNGEDEGKRRRTAFYLAGSTWLEDKEIMNDF